MGENESARFEYDGIMQCVSDNADCSSLGLGAAARYCRKVPPTGGREGEGPVIRSLFIINCIIQILLDGCHPDFARLEVHLARTPK